MHADKRREIICVHLCPSVVLYSKKLTFARDTFSEAHPVQNRKVAVLSNAFRFPRVDI